MNARFVDDGQESDWASAVGTEPRRGRVWPSRKPSEYWIGKTMGLTAREASISDDTTMATWVSADRHQRSQAHGVNNRGGGRELGTMSELLGHLRGSTLSGENTQGTHELSDGRADRSAPWATRGKAGAGASTGREQARLSWVTMAREQRQRVGHRA